MSAFDNLIGKRRPLGIGITPEVFRKDFLPLPESKELVGYSTNPRNAYGDWYEDLVEMRLKKICGRRNWKFQRSVNLGPSIVYRTKKVVDILINGELGLELKFLKGSGSLVQPKSIVDALDFTNRHVYCLYLVDGPGWLKSQNVEYLSRWWDFTCLKHLETTVDSYFRQGLASSSAETRI